MAVVTIPFDYDELDNPNSVVPICIDDTDRHGGKIARGWIAAVVPIADSLRRLARWRLEDEWRVSELTELSVHRVWYKHCDNLGRWPSGRIWHRACWVAEDLRAGGRRARRGLDEPLPEDETALAAKLVAADPKILSRLFPHCDSDFADEIERAELFAAITRQIRLRGDVDAGEMLDMIRHGLDREEISAAFDKKPNTVTQTIYRAIRRAVNDLGML
jgi:DNA-directed RNA polymerase specialized sigma24 family protein